MSSFLYTQVDVEKEALEAKEYAFQELSDHKKVTPCLTLYRGSVKVLSVLFPESDDRQSQFQETSFLVSSLYMDFMRLIMDSTIPLSVFKSNAGPDEVTDAILCVFGNKEGAYARPIPYLLHPENVSPIWQDDNLTSTASDFLRYHPFLLSFTASQFFMANNALNWSYYLEYLQYKGYKFNYHYPYTEENIGYGLSSTY